MIYKWQKEWNSGINGRWTKRLIEDIEVWITKKFGCVNFYLTHILTWRGCFLEYLYRFKALNSLEYHKCQTRSTKLIILMWQIPEDKKRELEVRLESEIKPKQVFVLHKLQCHDKWDTVEEFISTVLVTKGKKERFENNNRFN